MFEKVKDWWFGKYDPKEYWEKRGTEYIKEFKEGKRSFAVPRPILDRTLLDVISSIEFNSLMEIGCNFGKNLKLISEKFSGKEISGLDISTTALAEAKRFLNNEKIKLYNANADKTPFYDNEFDVVLVGEVFEHVPYNHFHPTLDEVSRIAKDYLILISPDQSRGSIISKIINSKYIFPIVKAKYCFAYDYVKEINARKNLRLVSQHPVDAKDIIYSNQIIYLIKKV